MHTLICVSEDETTFDYAVFADDETKFDYAVFADAEL